MQKANCSFNFSIVISAHREAIIQRLVYYDVDRKQL